MSLTLSPVWRQQYCDGAGVPYAGGKIYTYAAGTDTLQATYSDSAGLVPNPNPIVLDADGYAPAIYLSALSYKMRFFDDDDVLVPDLSQDNVGSTGLQSAALGQGFVLGGDAAAPIVAVAYPAGTTADKLHPGTVILPLDSGNLNGTYGLQGMLKGAGGGTISAALVNLSDGSPTTAIVTISSSDANGAIKTSVGAVFPAAGATKNYGVKTKMDLGTGFGWGFVLVKLS